MKLLPGGLKKKQRREKEDYDLYPDVEEEMYYESPVRRKRVQERKLKRAQGDVPQLTKNEMLEEMLRTEGILR